MNKVKLRAIVNIFSLFSFIISVISGLVMRSFPSGSGRSGITIWEVTKLQWREIHYYTNLIFIVLILIHLYLYWSYFKNLPKLLFRKEGQNE
ncbi:unnamed protein product [marine sediment metagenome]|uniref:Flavinylation-associated cytochrome domain-containing protein n=1 Tax=marine sediment metagenome TaxID=412755 RepID=X1MB82_9ZZZZ